MAMQLPYPSLLIKVVDRARVAVFKSRNNPDGIKPLYDEEEDEAHEHPFVWLVVGWSIGHPNTDLSHVEGDEAIDMSRPGYTGQYHVRLKIPQVEDAYAVPAGDTEDLVELIRGEFNRQLDGGPTAALCKPRDRKDRPKILQPKAGDRNSQQPYQSRGAKEPILPNNQMLLYRIWRARIAVVGDPARVLPVSGDWRYEDGQLVPYVWLGVGWNPDLSHTSPRHCRISVWGAEGLDQENWIYTCPIRVMTRVPQVEDLDGISEASGKEIMDGIKAELRRQLAEQTAGNQTSV